MEIQRAQIRFFKKNGFSSDSCEGLRHVKVLPYLSVVQSLEGSYDIALGNGEGESTGDGGFFIAPSDIRQTIVHHVNAESGTMRCRWVFLDVQINGTAPFDSLYHFPVVVKREGAALLNRIFDRLFESDDLLENYSDCYTLLHTLREMALSEASAPHPEIRNASDYITQHYREPITVRQLALLSKMSESNFYALFKRHLGSSPIAYLNHYRLSVAAELLAESSQTVSEISDAVGFADAMYFSKLFKRTYGMSPTEHRRMYRSPSAHPQKQ